MNQTEFGSIKIWNQSLSNRAESTKAKYRRNFNQFLEWSKLSPDELRDMKYEEDQTTKPWERSKVENLVREYIEYLQTEKKYACNTQHSCYTVITSFFSANGVPLNLTRQDRPIGCAFGSKTIKPDEIRKIANAAESLRDKALIMFLKDSGLRQSDVAKLDWRDLKDYGEGFMGFQMQTVKKKIKARGFVGSETTSILNIYKRKRLEGTKKIPAETNIEAHPLFSLHSDPAERLKPEYISSVVGDIIRLAAVDGATPHGLRKFWEQNIKVEKTAYQKQMNGRALDKTEIAYFWKETSELFEIYKNNYDNLRVERQDFKEVTDRLRRGYQKETETQRERIEKVERENLELKQRLNGYGLSNERVEELTNENEDMKNRLGTLESELRDIKKILVKMVKEES